MAKAPSIKVQLPPANVRCRELVERRPGEPAVACGQVATRLLRDPKDATRTAYAMCGQCAQAALGAGLRLVEQGEGYRAAAVAHNRPGDDNAPPEQVGVVEENPEGATPEQLARALNLAKEAQRIEDEIAELQALIALKAERLSSIQGGELPAAMKETGQQVIPLVGGVRAELGSFLSASIPKANKADAHAWMRTKEVNADDLIKRTITIEFGKNDAKWANTFLKQQARRKRPLNLKVDETVHSETLKKFVRERKAAGLPIDTSITVYEGDIARIVRPKADEHAREVEGM